jgi:hypothetical protein
MLAGVARRRASPGVRQGSCRLGVASSRERAKKEKAGSADPRFVQVCGFLQEFTEKPQSFQRRETLRYLSHRASGCELEITDEPG